MYYTAKNLLITALQHHMTYIVDWTLQWFL